MTYIIAKAAEVVKARSMRRRDNFSAFNALMWGCADELFAVAQAAQMPVGLGHASMCARYNDDVCACGQILLQESLNNLKASLEETITRTKFWEAFEEAYNIRLADDHSSYACQMGAAPPPLDGFHRMAKLLGLEP